MGIRIRIIIMVAMLCSMATFASAFMIINHYVAEAPGGSGTVSFDGGDDGASTTTTLTVDVPAETDDGDMLIAFVLMDADTTCSTPDLWTAITSIAQSSSRLYAFYKVASSEPASYDFTIGTTTGSLGFMQCYSKTSGNWSIGTEATGNATGTQLTTGEVTVANGGALAGCFGNDANIAITVDPDGMSIANTSITSNDVRATGYYQEYETGGSGISKSATYGSSEDMTAIIVPLAATE